MHDEASVTDAAWTSEELAAISNADELELSSSRPDGTLRDPVTIWVVRVADDLYVRAIKGTQGWFRGTRSRGEGWIASGSVEREVRFVVAKDDLLEEVDAAYRHKYRGYSKRIVDTVLTPDARASTLRLVPQS